jgi:hypothetical protein
MPFCFECGDELKGQENVLSCKSCGWSSHSIQNNGKSDKPKVCPDCEKKGKSMRQCGVCREAWFCSWCHSQRKRDIKQVYNENCRVNYHIPLSYEVSDSGHYCFTSYKILNLIKSFDTYEPCLECAKKLIVKLTKGVIPDIHNAKGANIADQFEAIDRAKSREKEIQLSLGFNKNAMFKNPLD